MNSIDHPYLPYLRTVAAILLCIGLAACGASIARAPLPEPDIKRAAPYGIEADLMRIWGDSLGLERSTYLRARRLANMQSSYAEEIRAGGPIRENALALSGGGPDGAYGAGLLKGWTESGKRPEFRIVTGISTGAIIALFAFLGPDYDPVLEEIYTTYETADLVETTLLSGLFGGPALSDTAGYRALMERYITDEVVAALAYEWETEKRLLIIGTTNLDASRPVVWNLGAIAASGHPMAKTLIQDVVQASSAIPVAFPPQIIPVITADGETYDEMHVDGGASTQVILFSPEFSLKDVDQELGVPVERKMFIVVNNKLDKPYKTVEPDALTIAGASLSSLIGGDAAGDVYQLFTVAQRDDIDFNLTFIPTEFDREAAEPFDPAYMKALFDLGVEHGLQTGVWSKYPPNYQPWP